MIWRKGDNYLVVFGLKFVINNYFGQCSHFFLFTKLGVSRRGILHLFFGGGDSRVSSRRWWVPPGSS